MRGRPTETERRFTVTTNYQPQPFQPEQPEQPAKKPFYKRIWLIALAVILVIGVAVAVTGEDDESTTAGAAETTEVVDEKVAEDTAQDTGGDVPREFNSALRKARTYSDMMHMSKAGVFDQLTSEYGEGFSAEAAQYAVDNVEADWNANALESARTYQDTMAMSPTMIHEQLVSEYGEKFTVEEADHALSNLEQ